MKIEDIYGFRDIQINIEALQRMIVTYQDRIDLLGRLDDEEAREIVDVYKRYIQNWFEQIREARKTEDEVIAFVDSLEERNWKSYLKYRYLLGMKPKACCEVFNTDYEVLKLWERQIKNKYRHILVYEDMMNEHGYGFQRVLSQSKNEN